ncbi:MAG: formimidoylglutamase [Bacteroidetes bacterium]|nr:formimidoylglutamase [Bacteroidota bacterium]
MKFVKIYTEEILNGISRLRIGEEKIGENIDCFSENWKVEIQNGKFTFVIVGIAEDIGVRANYGRGGAHTAFKPALESFLNQQANDFLNSKSIIVLGEIYVDDLMERAANIHTKNAHEINKLRDLVTELDVRVTEVVKIIISAGKIPIIIGGGHNNSFGNIAGASSALNKKINVVNCDPHLDFRPMEGRHSGNGFSYAFKNNYLQKYSVLAIHEQYNTSWALDNFKINSDRLFYNTYESIFVREEQEYKNALVNCINFVKGEACGVEIDLDAITNVPTSAKTSSGISPVQARQFVYQSAKNLQAVYLHIAEGAPILSHIKADNKTGKLIAYLITDFMKGCEGRN